MRRYLKIKTWPLLIAWLLIFLHGIIPHNHADECLAFSPDAIHCCDSGFHRDAGQTRYLDHNPDTRICHISNLLFNNLTDHHFFGCTDKVLIVSPEIPDSAVSIITDQSFSSHLYHGITSFRAPPVA